MYTCQQVLNHSGRFSSLAVAIYPTSKLRIGGFSEAEAKKRPDALTLANDTAALAALGAALGKHLNDHVTVSYRPEVPRLSRCASLPSARR